MGTNSEIAAMYNKLMTEIESQLRDEFPDLIWMVETYGDAVRLGKTKAHANGGKQPTEIFLMADLYKGDNRFDGKCVSIPFDDMNSLLSEDFRQTILEAAKELRFKLLNGILI